VAGRTTGGFPSLDPLQPDGGGASDAFVARIGPGLPGGGGGLDVPASGALSSLALAALVAGAGLALVARRGAPAA
jgi:hypothetical protein